MALFGRDTDTPTKPEPDEYDFDFSVLWQDEEQSSLLQYIIPGIQIILLIVVLIKVF